VTGLAARQEEGGRALLVAGLAGIAAAAGAAAVVSPVLALAAVLGLVFVGVAFQSLAGGLTLFTVLLFFERIPGIPASGLSAVKVGGGVLAAAWLAAVLARRRELPLVLRDHPLLAYASVFFAGWALASALWAEDVPVALGDAFRLAQGVLLFLIVPTAISERRHLRWVLWAFMGAAFVTAIIGLSGATDPESLDPYVDTTRLTGQIGDPNELAAILVPALAVAAFAVAVARAPLVGWILVSFVAVFAFALFLTQSRGGLVALGATFLAALLLAGPVRQRAVVVICVIAAGAVGYFTLVAPPESLERVTHFTSSGGTGRTDLWQIAGEVTGDHPVIGVGAGNFQVVEPVYAAGNLNLPRVDLIVDEPKVVHNTYLQVLTELGALGLTVFSLVVLGALALAVRGIRAFARAGDRESELLGRGLLIGTLGMLAAFVFISAQYEKALWLLLGLCAALPGLAARARTSAGA
jgi:O-antigen ligase